jgi:uncharacterized protein YceH (UPF0502 family)
MNELERRVFAVLIEKQLTTGDYPMTINALVNACNQKSNRDPVMDLDEDAVWNTLEALRERGLVSKVLPPMGSRVERFKHEIDNKLQWPKPQKVILCELMLRGPQTLSELRTRGSRMYVFESAEAVSAVLDALAALSPPLVAAMSRVPGQREIRYTHLLYPPNEKPPSESAPARSESADGFRGGASEPVRSAAAEFGGGGDSAMREQLEALQSEVAELHEQVAGLRRRLDTLEGR